jgi:hypothetical protein
LHNVCDGMNHIESRALDSDVPADDGDPCTAEVCSGGVSSHPPGNNGAVCSGPQGGRCSSGACIPTFMVVRVDGGGFALTNRSSAVFVERRYFDSMAAIVPVNGTIALPTSVSGMNQPLTLGGTGKSEGHISLSSNGQYATLGGYDVGLGVGGITSSGANPGQQCMGTTANCGAIGNTLVSNTPRVVGRIDASNVVDTSTTLTNAFDGNNIRGAVTTDGSAFWVTGAGDATAGVQYVLLGQNTGVQILTGTPFNTRVPQIVGGQLYTTSDVNPNNNVFTVGTGVPTTGGQSVTSFPGMPTTGSTSPYQFVLLDRDAGVAGMDTLYVADDRAVAGGGGVQRWTFDGVSWTLKATFTNGLTTSPSNTPAVRGLIALVSGNDVTLLATTGEAAPAVNKIIKYVDLNGTSTNPTGTVVGTAAANTQFRGLCLAP